MRRKLLIVEDNAINLRMLTKTLSGDYDLEEAENGRAAFSRLREGYAEFSAVLTDIYMPEMNGYELLSAIRDDINMTQLPVIMVTGSEDDKSRIKALTLGANDFIVKPYNPEIIKHCVKNNIALMETASMLKAIQKDKLTGLYNRESFLEKVSAAVREHEPGYYMMSCFDIDNFKIINDQYGAEVGDRLLHEIGRIVSENSEALDGFGGRVSGDNFAVLLPYSQRNISIMLWTQDKAYAFADMPVFVYSVGRYVINDLSLPASAIYDRAYIAKQSVKGRYDSHVAYFDDAMLNELVRARQINADMDAAIANRQFELWFQPQHNHITGALVGAEALVRWQHPEKGLISPAEFIPIFEQNGFIYELDKYVWRETCGYLRKWIDAGINPLPVSVNVSRLDVFRPDFLETISRIIEQYSVPADMLRLEITESAFAKSTQIIVGVVKRLISMGFTVEIDDFGSGYSSLNTLKSVPAQIIKLDMRFLEEDDDSLRGGNILESIVRMTKWLGMSVIAEGVEYKEQADYLASVGCSYVQGYLYSRPMPAADYEKYSNGAGKEAHLSTIDAVANLDNNAFWDPKSMDTLIFNSYVGGACIFEYHRGRVEILRATEKFAHMISGPRAGIEDALKIDILSHMDAENSAVLFTNLDESIFTRREVAGEYLFTGLPGCPDETYLRSSMRVIASAGDRYLVYCTNENITAQREAERQERLTQQRIQAAAAQIQNMMDDMPGGFVRMSVSPGGHIKPVYINDGFIKIIGMNHAETIALYGHDMLSAIHPDDQRLFMDSISEMLETKEAHSVRMRLARGGGGYVRVSVFGRATSDAAGNKYLNVYFTDVGERAKELETQRALLDSLPCGAGVYEMKDGQMNLVYQNNGYWDMVGLNDLSFPDPAPMSAIHPEDVPIIMNELSAAITQNRDVNCDIRLRHLTLGFRPAHLAARVLHEDSGALMICAIFTLIR